VKLRAQQNFDFIQAILNLLQLILERLETVLLHTIAAPIDCGQFSLLRDIVTELQTQMTKNPTNDNLYRLRDKTLNILLATVKPSLNVNSVSLSLFPF
jgi:hypothetical protein